MNIQPDCVPCLIKRVLFQARLADNGTEFEALRRALEAYAKEFGEEKNSAAVATKVHESAYSAMEIKDPYKELKFRADEVAAEYISIAEEFIDSSENRIKAATLMAAIGNIMDFGAGMAIDHPDRFREHFHRMVGQGIDSDDTDKMISALNKASNVIYIFDNCGESLFDSLLIKEIKRLGARVVGVVRGEPILNDVTYEDAERVGLDKITDRLLTSGQFAIGMDISKAGNDLKEEISNADMIIAKGMANYESLTDQDIGIPIVYILRSKCVPVAVSLGVPTDINVVRFVG